MNAQLPLFQEPVQPVLSVPANAACQCHSGVGHLLIAESIRQYRIDEQRAIYGAAPVAVWDHPQYFIATCGGMAGEW